MNDVERNYYNSFVRIRDFGVENNDVIKTFAVALSNFALVAAGVDEIEASGELQSLGAIGQGVVRKDFALADLRSLMRRINRTARSLAVDNPPIAELFRTPQGNNEQQRLAAARAFLTNAGPIQQQFIDYGMPADFIAGLEAAIETYEQAITQKNVAIDHGVGATASIGATLKATLKAVRRLRGIVPNIFADDPARLAAWESARHVERPAKSKTVNAPPGP